MRRSTITFRLESDKKKALDHIAADLDRDRSFVLNEAINSYLEVHRWQVEHIEEGARQANAGHFAKATDVADAFKKWHK